MDPMTNEFELPPLTREQHDKIARLTDAQVQAIDAELLAHVTTRWRKVARVVGTAMGQMENRIVGIPDIYYAERVGILAERGLVEIFGNPAFMRYSEVRLPADGRSATEPAP